MTITISPSDEQVFKTLMKRAYPGAEALIDGLNIKPGANIPLTYQVDATTTADVLIAVKPDGG